MVAIHPTLAGDFDRLMALADATDSFVTFAGGQGLQLIPIPRDMAERIRAVRNQIEKEKTCSQ